MSSGRSVIRIKGVTSKSVKPGMEAAYEPRLHMSNRCNSFD